MRKLLGGICMLLGLAMLAGAGGILYVNHHEDTDAGEEAGLTLSRLKATIAKESASADEIASGNVGYASNAGNSAEKTLYKTALPTADESMTVEVDVAPTPQAPPSTSAEMPVLWIDGDEYIGYLEMPTIDISLPVMRDWSYPSLRKSPCRYYGSAADDTLVILAHNYARHFGKIRNLAVGDPVQFVDAEGTIYRYKVVGQEILKPYETKRMVNSDADLTLFTCTYGGRTRISVRLERSFVY